MAQKYVTIYTDDLTGKETDEATTHSFALDGVRYEIDLAPESYDQLLEAMAPFMAGGRKVGREKGARAARATDGGPSAEEIRTWAREQDIAVSERGRVPVTVREQYNAAH